MICAITRRGGAAYQDCLLLGIRIQRDRVNSTRRYKLRHGILFVGARGEKTHRSYTHTLSGQKCFCLFGDARFALQRACILMPLFWCCAAGSATRGEFAAGKRQERAQRGGHGRPGAVGRPPVPHAHPRLHLLHQGRIHQHGTAPAPRTGHAR